MGRPRLASDQELLDAAREVVAARGPAEFTLADVGRKAGLSPAAVLARFGSKRGLLLAIAKGGAAEVAALFEAARKAHPDARLDALVAALADGARFAGTAEEVANGLQFLQLDLTDPDFRKLTRAQFRALRAAVAGLLDEAVGQGELQRCDTARLAVAIEAAYHGAILAWAVHRDGSAPGAVRLAVEQVLEPRRA